MHTPSPLRAIRAVCLGSAALALAGIAGCGSADQDGQGTPAPVTAEAQLSLTAFQDVAKVLRHPRCINCHPSGDRPHVGDDGRIHGMNVQRGPGNHGNPGQRCDTCHRDANQELARIPGAPHWHLAPLSMGWVGLDDHGLAQAVTDRARNGDRSLEALYEHMAHDPLVLWGWDPDSGRSAIPMPHGEFLQSLRTWIDNGAAIPAPGTTSTF